MGPLLTWSVDLQQSCIEGRIGHRRVVGPGSFGGAEGLAGASGTVLFRSSMGMEVNSLVRL